MLQRLRQNPIKRWFLVGVLPGVAGLVNGAGFYAFGAFTSHMSGNVARIGDELAQGHLATAFGFTGVVLAFLLGTIIASTAMELARRQARARYIVPLGLEAAALWLVTGWSLIRGEQLYSGSTPLIALLGFAMGLQNAMVTRLSGAVIRTTHITGIITDVGIELVRTALWCRDTLRNHPLKAWLTVLNALRVDPELDRIKLHGAILLSFVLGAVLGPFLYLHVGQKALLLPVVVLLGLLAFDRAIGLDPAHAPAR